MHKSEFHLVSFVCYNPQDNFLFKPLRLKYDRTNFIPDIDFLTDMSLTWCMSGSFSSMGSTDVIYLDGLVARCA